jgi:dephospho-CoA kinase
MAQVAVVGLTGGIASGKSTLARFLSEELGVQVVSGDALGHACYEPGQPAHEAIVREFGPSVLLSPATPPAGGAENRDSHGNVVSGADSTRQRAIDRAALGAIVFSDRERLRALSAIVWPCIRTRLETIIAQLSATEGQTMAAGAAATAAAAASDAGAAGAAGAAASAAAGVHRDTACVAQLNASSRPASAATPCAHTRRDSLPSGVEAEPAYDRQPPPSLAPTPIARTRRRLVIVEAAVLVEAGWEDLFDEVWVVTVPEETACRRLMARNQLSEEQARHSVHDIAMSQSPYYS